MRDCNGCTACCTWLVASIYGWEIGNGKSCKFLECNGCGVHKARAKVCKEYFCAWAQELFPEEMRPDKCGIIASVERNQNGQYLKIVKTDDSLVSEDILEYLNIWSEKMNTPIVYTNL